MNNSLIVLHDILVLNLEQLAEGLSTHVLVQPAKAVPLLAGSAGAPLGILASYYGAPCRFVAAAFRRAHCFQWNRLAVSWQCKLLYHNGGFDMPPLSMVDINGPGGFAGGADGTHRRADVRHLSALG